NKLLTLGVGCLSLDAPFDSDGATLGDSLIGDYNPVDDSDLDLYRKVTESMSVLSDRQKQILMSYFGLNGPKLTLEEISEEFEITRERVRQIKEAALKKMRRSTLLSARLRA